MNRCFIALEIGEKAKKQCENVISILKESGFLAKWVEKENLHITLFFLGEITDEEIKEVTALLEKLDHLSFQLFIDKVGFFQKNGKPTTIWLGIEKSKPIQEVYSIMRSKLENIFNIKFREKYSPHLTLGRIKHTPEDWMQKLKKMTVETVEIGEIVFSLKRSTLTKEGPIYETLATKVF